jgi:hypothetical protein
LNLIYRRDGTYDCWQAGGVSDKLAVGILRGVADQMEAGATIEVPAP